MLDMPEVRERISRLSVEEYHRLDEFNENGHRTELIRGLVIEKMPKSPLHCTLAALLYRLLSEQISAPFTIWRERPLTLSDSEPEPDISVTKGTTNDFRMRHPSTAELVVEIASSTVRLDRENASIYAEAGVKEYWIVPGNTRQVEVYHRPEGGRYTEMFTAGAEESIQSESLPGISLPIAELFRK